MLIMSILIQASRDPTTGGDTFITQQARQTAIIVHTPGLGSSILFMYPGQVTRLRCGVERILQNGSDVGGGGEGFPFVDTLKIIAKHSAAKSAGCRNIVVESSVHASG